MVERACKELPRGGNAPPDRWCRELLFTVPEAHVSHVARVPLAFRWPSERMHLHDIVCDIGDALVKQLSVWFREFMPTSKIGGCVVEAIAYDACQILSL